MADDTVAPIAPPLEARRLGRLEQVDLRSEWTSESAEFTPWLAKPENLELLGETLGLNLELESVEATVGSFRADIVCKDIGTETLVLIENQLEQTDHDHLGKLLTYAAGRKAVTLVWLAARFREEHRATVDWLNAITHEDFRIFGLQIELWQIGDSAVAPKFEIVSMPNDWSKLVTGESRTIQLTESRLKLREYWEALHDKLNEAGGPVRGTRKAQPHSGMGYSIGTSGFVLYAVASARDKFMRAELYISGEGAEERHDLLEHDKEEIHRELGYPLEWGSQSDTARDRRIAVYRRDVDPGIEADWPEQHEWLVKHLNDLHRVFAQRIRVIGAA